MTSPAFTFSREDIHNLIRQTSIVAGIPFSTAMLQLQSGNVDMKQTESSPIDFFTSDAY